MKAVSDLLIHFLGRDVKSNPGAQTEIFKKIIEEGLRCSKIETKFSFYGTVMNYAVCFTDTPLSLCDEHTAIYGKFGIGFRKSYVKNLGGNPARYFIDYTPTETNDDQIIENRGLLYYNLCERFQAILGLKKRVEELGMDGLYDQHGELVYSKEQIEAFCSNFIQMLSFEKPTGDLGPARDETDSIDEYYKEREWRIVPFLGSFISGKAIINEQEQIHYRFTRNDCELLIVPNDETRIAISEWLHLLKEKDDPRLKEFGKNPPPILIYDDLNRF